MEWKGSFSYFVIKLFENVLIWIFVLFQPKLSNPLNCSYVVEGHSNSVLAVKVNDNILYTAAAGNLNNKFLNFENKKLKSNFFISDRTVRIWDLSHTNGPIGLLSHPGPVVGVEYDRKTNLLYSACGAFIRVWDLRSNNGKPLKTLSSSGSTLIGSANVGVTQVGESPITAMSIGVSGNLYSAASDKVRIWDLRR